MTTIDFEPWPSTYKMGEEITPSKLHPNSSNRKAGAFIAAIPPFTVEPPQIHLIAKRDGKPFQELITDFEKNFRVGYYNPKSQKYWIEEYFPGKEIIIPEYRIHWLINPHNTDLNFTCEYAPYP